MQDIVLKDTFDKINEFYSPHLSEQQFDWTFEPAADILQSPLVDNPFFQLGSAVVRISAVDAIT